MTTMSRSRVLKASDGAAEHVVLMPTSPAEPVVDPAGHEPDAPTILDTSYTADEVEQLCREARESGVADAAALLEPALHRIAEGLEELNDRGAEALALALHADSERVVRTALDVARWVLGRELNDEVEVLSLATRALAESGAPYATRIRVSPELADALGAIAPADVDVVADGNLEPGEFTTETEGPDVSFRYTAALERARGALSDGVGG